MTTEAESIRQLTTARKATQNEEDYRRILHRSDGINAAHSIRDILYSKRLPYDFAEVLPPLKTSRSAKTSRLNTANSVAANSLKTNNRSPRGDHAATTHSKKSLEVQQSPPSVSSTQLSAQEHTLDGQLKYILSLLLDAKSHCDPSRLYFEAAQFFEQIQIFDRSVSCMEKVTKASDPARIVDETILICDDAYKRKLERMSPVKLPQFLQQRRLQRQQLIKEETENQRLRVKQAHCELCRLTCLVPSVRDLWRAHSHMQQALQYCKTDEETRELMWYFHRLMVSLSDAMGNQAQFTKTQQILRGSAGPMADAHLALLLELEPLNPDNVEIHRWLGFRYTEKCMLAEAQEHFRKARDLQEKAPEMQATLDLWQRSLRRETEDDQAAKETILANINKHKLTEYSSCSSSSAAQDDITIDSKKDYAWFTGCHVDSSTVIYRPPPQGWTSQSF